MRFPAKFLYCCLNNFSSFSSPLGNCIQISSTPHRFWRTFKPPTFNFGTMMRVGQWECLDPTVRTLFVDMVYQGDSHARFQLCCPEDDPFQSVNLHLHRSPAIEFGPLGTSISKLIVSSMWKKPSEFSLGERLAQFNIIH